MRGLRPERAVNGMTAARPQVVGWDRAERSDGVDAAVAALGLRRQVRPRQRQHEHSRRESRRDTVRDAAHRRPLNRDEDTREHRGVQRQEETVVHR
jgi:hypothetical protein